MNLWVGWLALPLAVRLGLLAILGLFVGGQINRGIYRLAWHARWISPWTVPPVGHPQRGWRDRLPILGWFALRRETRVHGHGFWIRPLLIELATAAVFAGLYWWEVVEQGLLEQLPGLPPAHALQVMLHAQYLAHVVLFSLIMVASFIDFDEKMIPDAITVSGTLFALLLMGVLPHSLLPTVTFTAEGPQLHLLWAGAPPWPGWFGSWQGLLAVLALYSLWCFALLDKTTTLRHGWRRGASYLLVSIYRRRSWYLMLPLFVIGSLYLVGMWQIGGLRWTSVSSSVVGMAYGGAIIWGVRIVGRAALGIEAMGFGDVTLLAMIGAFLGWQAAAIVFFLAPIAALLIAVAQWLTTGTHYIAFGPYLSLAAITLIVGWTYFWANWLQPFFEFGPIIAGVMAVCLVLMGVLLWALRLFREHVLGLKYR